MNIINHPHITLDLKHIQIVSNFYVYVSNFDCSGYAIDSLYGSPRIVKGNFLCSFDLLESLEHCPKYVGGDFICISNKVQFTEEYVRSLCEVKGKVYC